MRKDLSKRPPNAVNELIFKGTDELYLSRLRKVVAKIVPSLLVIFKRQ